MRRRLHEPDPAVLLDALSLRDLVERCPGVAHAFRRDAAIDGTIFREWLLSVGRRSAREHLAHMLCETAMRLHAVDLPSEHMPFGLADLADALGIPSAQVTQELQQLRREGLIEIGPSTLLVLSLQGLAKICDFDPA